MAARRASLSHDDGALRRLHRQHGDARRACPRRDRPAIGVLRQRRGRAARQGVGRCPPRPRLPGPLRIGYVSGTITHDHDWYYVEPAILEVLRRHRDVELWLGGYLPETSALEPFASRVRRIPFLPWYQLPQVLANLDVNLAPLEPDSIFNDGKSAIKWMEAALAGTPTVASATASFVDAIDPWHSGVLAVDLDDWEAALDRLLADEDLRARMANQARRDALLRWSPHLQGRRYVDLLNDAFTWRDQRRSRSGWTDVIADEPFQPRPLEEYVTGPPADLQALLELSQSGPVRRGSWWPSRLHEGRPIARTRAIMRRLA